MRLPTETVAFLDTTVHTVQTHTTAGDTIFTYPEMNLLYDLADRWFPTQAGSHNMDVIPDWLMKQETERLVAHKPAVLIYAHQNESALRNDEKLWRNSKPSGQRYMQQQLDALVDPGAHQYVLTHTYLLAPNDDPINVYVRADKVR